MEVNKNVGDNTLRTFLAIDGNSELIELQKETIQKLEKTGFKANWAKPENIHLTLFFLGYQTMHSIAEAAYKLGERVSGFPTFVFDVLDLGYFEFKEEPKVIWYGVSEVKKLTGLYSEIKSGLISSGLDMKSETFVPHITVGRVKKCPEHWKNIIETINFESIKIPVSSVGIYSSKLTKSGPIYTKLYTIDFEGGVIING